MPTLILRNESREFGFEAKKNYRNLLKFPKIDIWHLPI